MERAPTGHSGAVIAWLDRKQRRHPGLGFPLAVLYKFFDDQGSYLAALITYYAFVSLFPLLLLLTSVLGVVLRGHPAAQQSVLHSALSQFPVIGSELGDPRHLGGSTAGVVLGVLGALYGGLGVAQAGQNAMNVCWAVPRNNRPNPLKVRGRSLLLLTTVGLAVVATTVLSGIAGSGDAFGAHLGSVATVLVIGVSVLLNVALFAVGFRIATATSLTWSAVAPGAVAAGVGWQVLQSVGSLYVKHVVKGASATNGVFALVLGLIAWIYLESVIVVFCVEANVVRAKTLWPRALLTPFTDAVDLTTGDEATYADAAKAQRHKGFEEVDVTFHPRR